MLKFDPGNIYARFSRKIFFVVFLCISIIVLPIIDSALGLGGYDTFADEDVYEVSTLADLKAAIAEAEAAPAGTAVTIALLNNITLTTLTTDTVTVPSNTIIKLTSASSAPSACSLNGGGLTNTPILKVEAGATLLLENIVITNSGRNTNTTAGGACGINSADATIIVGNGAVISNNRGSTGAGIYAVGGTVIVNSGSLITGNQTRNANNTDVGAAGGGIFMSGGQVFINGGLLSNNISGGTGGGALCLNNSASGVMTAGEISGNTSGSAMLSGPGGGISLANNSTFIMRNGLISNNTSANPGGGVSVYTSSAFTLENGIISGNKGSSGGGIGINNGTFTMLNGLITGNRATPNDGGGIYVSNTSASPLYNVQINGGTISGNTAAGHGGGIYAAPQQSTTAYFSLSDSVITGNSAGGNGGGLYKSGQSPVNIINTLISDNDAVNGAGIFQFRDTISLLGTTLISANRASGDGGGVYVSGPTVSGQTWSSWFTMSGYAAVSDNIASGNGGGIFSAADGSNANPNPIILSGNSVVSGNTAGMNGGGIYVVSSRADALKLQDSTVISGNTAIGTPGDDNTGNGGGIWVTNSNTNLNRVKVAAGVVFSGNSARAAYDRNPADPTVNATYSTQIAAPSTAWTSPLTQGYNNFDISYVWAEGLILTYTVTVNNSYAATTGAGSGYRAGNPVTINAGTRSGYTFTGWTVNLGGVTLANTNSATTTFTMPDKDVTVTAGWKLIVVTPPPVIVGPVDPPPPPTPPPLIVDPPDPDSPGPTVTPPLLIVDPADPEPSGPAVTPPAIIDPVEPLPANPVDPQPSIQGTKEIDPLPIAEETLSQAILNQLIDKGVPILNIGGQQIPLISLTGMSTWALINLILAVLGVFFTAVTTLRLRSHRKLEAERTAPYSPDKDRQSFRAYAWIVPAIIFSVFGVIIFMLTQNTNSLMVLFDRWTIVNTIAFIAVIITTKLALRQNNDRDFESGKVAESISMQKAY